MPVRKPSPIKGLSPKGTVPLVEIFSWCLYDFANSAFTTVIVTVAYSIYFKDVVVPVRSEGDFYWGLCDSVAMLITALLAPFLGALADHAGRKKSFLISFASISILCTSLLYSVGPGSLMLGMALFILADIGFNAGNSVYDAFLPEISTPQNVGRVSGYGWGLGYIGGLVSLVIAYPFLKGGYETPEALSAYPIGFLTTAGHYAVFSIPLVLFLRERAQRRTIQGSPFAIGFARLRETLTHLRKHREALKFLAAFFFYSDAINTVIVFSSIYAREVLHFSVPEVMVFFITVQTTALIGAVVSGNVLDRIGPRNTISLTLFLWMGIILGAYFVETKWAFYIVGLAAGIGIGSTQPCSRSMMTFYAPVEKRAEFFGFFSIFNKFSGVLGPVLFGTLSSFAGGPRLAILSVGAFFVLGLLILRTVK